MFMSMKLNKPFIRLPYQFDAIRLAEEVNSLSSEAWMEHPSKLKGNSALALISRDAGDNDEFDGHMLCTPHLEKCDYIQQVMAGFGEVLGRSRLMQLAPGCEVSSHVDFNYHWYTRVRIHIPVVTNPDVQFYCGADSLHMAAGQCWIFDSWRRHNVVNNGSEARVHLVIDAAGSSKFWQMVRQMEALDNDAFSTEKAIKFTPYLAENSEQCKGGDKPVVQTERYNISPVMSPGELEGLVEGVIADFEHNPKNDPALIDSYREMLRSFGKDWRQLWLLYGYEKQGRPHYAALINSVYKGLPPDRRALLTSSNDVGVNPVVVQRILRAALYSESNYSIG